MRVMVIIAWILLVFHFHGVGSDFKYRQQMVNLQAR